MKYYLGPKAKSRRKTSDKDAFALARIIPGRCNVVQSSTNTLGLDIINYSVTFRKPATLRLAIVSSLLHLIADGVNLA